jgi:hypothetical protein
LNAGWQIGIGDRSRANNAICSVGNCAGAKTLAIANRAQACGHNGCVSRNHNQANHIRAIGGKHQGVAGGGVVGIEARCAKVNPVGAALDVTNCDVGLSNRR